MIDTKRVAAMRDQLKWLREQRVELMAIEGVGDSMAYRPEAVQRVRNPASEPHADYRTENMGQCIGAVHGAVHGPTGRPLALEDWPTDAVEPITPITGHHKLIDVVLTEPQIVTIVDVLRSRLRFELDRPHSDAVDDLEDLIYHMKSYRG